MPCVPRDTAPPAPNTSSNDARFCFVRPSLASSPSPVVSASVAPYPPPSPPPRPAPLPPPSPTEPPFSSSAGRSASPWSTSLRLCPVWHASDAHAHDAMNAPAKTMPKYVVTLKFSTPTEGL